MSGKNFNSSFYFGAKNISECFNGNKFILFILVEIPKLVVIFALGLPIFVSMPHFLNANQSLIEAVEGLKPNKDNHDLSLSLDPVTGTLFKLVVRYQVNAYVFNKPGLKLEILKNLRPILLPIYWVEEVYEIDSDSLDSLRCLFFSYKTVFIFNLISLYLGIILILFSILFLITKLIISKFSFNFLIFLSIVNK